MLNYKIALRYITKKPHKGGSLNPRAAHPSTHNLAQYNTPHYSTVCYCTLLCCTYYNMLKYITSTKCLIKGRKGKVDAIEK